MGKVEKWGLLALFVLCALIVGVGMFGGDGSTPVSWEPSQSPGDVEAAEKDGPSDWQSREQGRPTASEDRSDRLEPAPPPGRDRSFPEDRDLWSAAPPFLEPQETDPPGVGGGRAVSGNEPPPPSTGGQPSQTEGSRLKVRPGDSFVKIAKRELGSEKHTDALMAANPGIPPTRLLPGQLLHRPDLSADGSWTYRVRKGDTLQKISMRFYKTTKLSRFIAKANRMGTNDTLGIGRELRIPPRPQPVKKKK